MIVGGNLRVAYLLVLASMPVVAQEPADEHQRPRSGGDLWWRSAELAQHPAYTGPLTFRQLEIPADPKRSPRYVYVAGGVPTTLRFPEPVDPGGTTLEGAAGRFEPPEVKGRYVILYPIRDLEPDQRFMLSVKLASGAEIPLTVASGSIVDGAITFVADARSVEVMRYALAKQAREIEALQTERQRELEIGVSVDHALATLLAKGEVALTPFVERGKWWHQEEDVDVVVTVYGPKKTGGTRVKAKVDSKAGVVFTVTNRNVVPWEFEAARLTIAGTETGRPFALRATSHSIALRQTGSFAVVMGFNAHDTRESVDGLLVELFRAGGQRQAYVLLKPEDILR